MGQSHAHRLPGTSRKSLRPVAVVTCLCLKQSQSVVLDEVFEVLEVERGQGQVVGEAAGSDPSVVDWPRPSALGGGRR